MRRARDNPFAVHRVLRERYRLLPPEWQALLAGLARLGRRAAIVGPHGSGKTTLLEDLGSKLAEQGWRTHLLRLNADQRRPGILSRWDEDDFVLCDGAEQLSLLDWRRLAYRARRAGGLVITTHQAGRLPTLHLCETSPELLRSLVLSLGEPLSAPACAAIYARHRGNIRAALSELYDAWARNESTSSEGRSPSETRVAGGECRAGQTSYGTTRPPEAARDRPRGASRPCCPSDPD